MNIKNSMYVVLLAGAFMSMCMQAAEIRQPLLNSQDPKTVFSASEEESRLSQLSDDSGLSELLRKLVNQERLFNMRAKMLQVEVNGKIYLPAAIERVIRISKASLTRLQDDILPFVNEGKRIENEHELWRRADDWKRSFKDHLDYHTGQGLIEEDFSYGGQLAAEQSPLPTKSNVKKCKCTLF